MTVRRAPLIGCARAPALSIFSMTAPISSSVAVSFMTIIITSSFHWRLGMLDGCVFTNRVFREEGAYRRLELALGRLRQARLRSLAPPTNGRRPKRLDKSPGVAIRPCGGRDEAEAGCESRPVHGRC